MNRWGPHVDQEATHARNFADPMSHIMRDGREILYRDDYKQRVREVLERDGGKCQCMIEMNYAGETFAHVPCGEPASVAHHKIKRSKGRDDRAENLVSLCHYHHDAIHKEFKPRFGEKGQ